VLGAWCQQQQAVKKLQRELSVLFTASSMSFISGRWSSSRQLDATTSEQGCRQAALLDALQSTLAGVAVGIGEAVDVALQCRERRWKPVRAHVD